MEHIRILSIYILAIPKTTLTSHRTTCTLSYILSITFHHRTRMYDNIITLHLVHISHQCQVLFEYRYGFLWSVILMNILKQIECMYDSDTRFTFVSCQMY